MQTLLMYSGNIGQELKAVAQIPAIWKSSGLRTSHYRPCISSNRRFIPLGKYHCFVETYIFPKIIQFSMEQSTDRDPFLCSYILPVQLHISMAKHLSRTIVHGGDRTVLQMQVTCYKCIVTECIFLL